MRQNRVVLSMGIALVSVCSSTWFVGCDSGQTGQQERTLRCPEERSIGTLFIRPEGSEGPWQTLGEAKGQVSIPAGQEVFLDMYRDDPLDLSPLDSFASNDLAALDLSVANFDRGALAHVSRLRSLRRLDLNSTSITSEDLSLLGELRSLEFLNLQGTRLNDSCVRHLTALKSLRRLELPSTLSEESVAEIERQLPKATISF